MITDGHYDSESGKFVIDNQLMSLRDCLKFSHIDGSLPCSRDGDRLASLKEILRKGIICEHQGTFKTKESIEIPLDVALRNGNIINTEIPFTLFDALKFGLFTDKGKLINPRNGLLITLKIARITCHLF
ncbi:dystonin [Caerostris extrusa]|uniref:Dystonin n=1 Tax=Caerostris extrusa TaxID=172846 RepID=A0AAV4XW52_CAEEX|nr:dystonin [Caerostris extrusa]